MNMFLVMISLAWGLELVEVKVQDNEHFTLQGCKVFHIGTNYKRTELHFAVDRFQDLSYLRYSDVLGDTCDLKGCPTGSAICGEISGESQRSTEVVIGACISDLYVYVKTKPTSTISNSISIIAAYLQGQCDHIEETLYATCGSMNYKECDRCDDQCRVAECVQSARHDQPEKILQTLCLPYTVESFELNTRCLGYKAVDFGKWKQGCDDSIDTGSVGAGTVVALVLIMMGFFAFVGAVTWYNWKLKTSGVPPVRCFGWCPAVLFPRPRQPAPQSFYKPPDISMQSFK
jgi:hypothetical protein